MQSLLIPEESLLIPKESLLIYASRVKELGQVPPETAFKGTWKRLAVTIHDESLLTPRMPRIRNSNKVT